MVFLDYFVTLGLKTPNLNHENFFKNFRISFEEI